jgi:hypothetical protein
MQNLIPHVLLLYHSEKKIPGLNTNYPDDIYMIGVVN